jgi:putative endonuclease
VYYVYILASRKHGTLYIGVTNDLIRRVYEHKTDAVRGFTSRYGVHLLVWFGSYDDVVNAIEREKELKKWRREWKINLIESSYPNWVDLFESLASWSAAGEPGLHTHRRGYGFRARRFAAPRNDGP